MTTVWVNGCFDLVHIAHIRLLKYAASLGNVLIVGIDSDERVRSMKGENRPINSAEIRNEFLESLSCVDLVVEFNTDEELCNHIQELQVDIMVVGEEYKDKKVIGSEFAKEVRYFKKVGNFSTTNILNNGQQV